MGKQIFFVLFGKTRSPVQRVTTSPSSTHATPAGRPLRLLPAVPPHSNRAGAAPLPLPRARGAAGAPPARSSSGSRKESRRCRRAGGGVHGGGRRLAVLRCVAAGGAAVSPPPTPILPLSSTSPCALPCSRLPGSHSQLNHPPTTTHCSLTPSSSPQLAATVHEAYLEAAAAGRADLVSAFLGEPLLDVACKARERAVACSA